MIPMLLAQAAPGLVEKSAGGFETILSMVMIPVVAIGVLIALLMLLKKMANLYYKVPPNKALVVYGRGKLQIITGGAKLLVPFVSSWFEMDLSAFQVNLELKTAPNKDKVPINVRAVATVCIGEDEELLANAARKFGAKSIGEIVQIAHATLEGQFRQVISQTDMETILSERSKFNATTQETAGKELAHLGFKLLMLNIQEVTDDNGYIVAQGKAKIAEVKADAEIKTAEQTRRQTIETTNAMREASVTKAGNDAQTADAERDLQKKKATYDAEVATERAKADQAGPLATAVASKAVKVATVDTEEAETQARIKLQDSVAKLTEAELRATVIKKAEADANALAIVAEGVKNKQLIEAEASGQARNIAANATATASIKESEGEASKIRTVGTAQAEMTAKNGQAEADATKAKLLAEAAGQTAQAEALKAKLLAEAAGQTAMAEAERALLVAKAECAAKLNEAYAKLTPEAQKIFVMQQVLERLPAVIEAAGKAGANIMEPFAQSMTAALGAMDNVTIYDSGNGAGGGGGALDRFASLGPDTLFKLFTNLKASGMFPVINALAIKHLGVDLNAAGQTIDVEPAIVPFLKGDAKSGK